MNRSSLRRRPVEQLCDDLWPLRVDTAVSGGGPDRIGEADTTAGEAILARQYIFAGKTLVEAQKDVAILIRLTHETTICWGEYEQRFLAIMVAPVPHGLRSRARSLLHSVARRNV
jgi:hypothetical protein